MFNLDTFLQNPNTQILSQILGFIAMSIAFIGFLQKDDKKTLKIIILSCIFWIFHFLLMGVFSAAVASGLGLIRTFLSLRYKRDKRIFSGIIAATIVFGIISYENHLSILPIVGSCISAYGVFFFEKFRLRVFMFITSLFWLTFNINIGSFGGTIYEVVAQIILIIAMYKILHEEGKRVYFVDKIMQIISKKEALPDVGRFIVIYDYIKIFKSGIKNKYKVFTKNIKKLVFSFIKKRK